VKKSLLIVLSILASLSLFAAIKVGVTAPLQTENGAWIKQAVTMAAEEINAKGGIDGEQV